jgi:hypothetical protein
MTANRGLFVPLDGTVGTTPAEARLALAGLLTEQSAGVIREGILDQYADPLVTGAANMSYNVGPCNPVKVRVAGEGPYVWSLTGTTNVPTDAAPGTGSRYDLIYTKQNDTSKGDANNLAEVGVVKGLAATTPSKPTASLPAGALVLAEALVTAAATATNGAGVTITQVWRHTAARGAAVRVRNLTEQNEFTSPREGQQVYRLDTDETLTYAKAGWRGRVWRHWHGTFGQVVPYATVTNLGTFAATTDSVDPSFLAVTTGQVTIEEPGLYECTVNVNVDSPVGTNPRAFVEVNCGGTGNGKTNRGSIPSPEDTGTLSFHRRVTTANEVWTFQCYHNSTTSGTRPFVGDVRITRLG